MVTRCCDLAKRLEKGLRANGVVVLNDVVLNQVLVRFVPQNGGDENAFTRAVIARVQADGVAWASGTKRQGKDALRISVSNWSTLEADIDRTIEAIAAAMRAVEAGRS
jgi:glutamate/tyrosine decarboxylase-like PLP-dependent enzyme